MADVKTDSKAAWGKLGLLLVLVASGAALASLTPVGDYLSRDGIGEAIEWIRGSTAAPLLYIAIYAAATALAIPGSVLTIAGGAIFGLVQGTIYTTIAANLGANIAFLIGRTLGRDGIEKIAGDRLDKLDKATDEHGFRALLTLRLIPAVPFNALNFGSGLTSIPWGTYALATAIGIFPGTFVYTMFADALLAGSQEASRDAFLRVLLSGALLVMLSLLPILARRLGVRIPGSSSGAASAFWIGAVGLGIAAAPVHAQAIPDHSAFTEILSEVVEQPRVDYAALADDRARFEEYLTRMAATDPAALAAADADTRLAFWINAYNACMLHLVVDNYPIQKRGGLLTRLKNAFADRPANSVWQIPDVFQVEHCEIAGELRSQDEIEHEIIRPMGDPRIHFAVNCAARSCPPLWPEAYTAERLQEQLDRAVDYLTSQEVHLAVEADRVRLNKVLDWYKEDFGGIEGLRAFLAPYVPTDVARAILDPDVDIEFFEYDWTLNDVER